MLRAMSGTEDKMTKHTYTDSLILNVDDSDGARYAKTRTLELAGFTVIEAASGGEALQRATVDKPDLVLLDVKLPDINGFEVCRLLKNNAITQPILVLQTSASYISAADKIRALDDGADNYLFEPIEPEELVANVKALLRLGRAERELREADRRKDVFIATLAHELRNPLGPIRNSVELLKLLDPQASEVQARAREIILRQTSQLTRLVDDLLDVSRITQGTIILRKARVELKTFIEAAIETMAPFVQSRQHALTLDLPPAPVWIEGDAIRLAQIIGNLLHNAAKFTPQGGRLSIAARQNGDEVRISVTDNGIGIAADDAPLIFNLFSQASHAADRAQDGLGIGLSLVKSLVELHGGAIETSSAGAGQGSTFEVRLPACKEDAGAIVESAPHAGSTMRRRILIVDDNKDAANMLGALLELAGNTVQMRFNGTDALACASIFQPDIVFLDIGLPDMTGYDVALRLRQMDGLKDVMLIALTGYGQEKDKAAALSAGFNRHLSKPVDYATLDQLLRGTNKPGPADVTPAGG
jgi:two-component system, sensor histidine kinase